MNARAVELIFGDVLNVITYFLKEISYSALIRVKSIFVRSVLSIDRHFEVAKGDSRQY